MTFVSVDTTNQHLLKQFIDQLGEAARTFRYFNKRKVDTVQNHLVTLLLLEAGETKAYGHLEEEGEDVWLGICVSPLHQGQGLGKRMMQQLFEAARDANVAKISLTVDAVNLKAINMYKAMGFLQTGEQNAMLKFEASVPQEFNQ